MSGVGRGRGYTGRHSRPPQPEDSRTRTDLSPRTTEPRERDGDTDKREKEDREVREKEREREKEEEHIMENLESISAEDDAVLKELLHIDEQYQPLLVLLEQFSPSEDGIQFNRKLRHFETTISNMCPDENRLQQAFATFRAAALLNPVTARKLAGVGASFTRQQRQQLLRSTLLNVIMQGTYSKLDILERANPLFLINASNLMGDYFAEARLCNGNKVHILAAPLLHYMKALLATDDVRAHRSLATQLMQNGRELVSVLPQEVDELSIGVRVRVLSPPPCGIIWLLLSADMCLNKFLPLPDSLQRFYATHLKLTPEESYSEATYGSWKKMDKEEDSTEKVAHNISNLSLEDDAKPKLRPILGAGAGLLRQEQNTSSGQESVEPWSQPKGSLSKRYDLNSWRQEGEALDPKGDGGTPHAMTDFPPPRYQSYEYNSYLQQGDGAYIQNYNQTNEQFYTEEDKIEKVNNELQKSGRKPVENWRKDKDKEEKWTRRSRDSLSEEDESRTLSKGREIRLQHGRRHSEANDTGVSGKTPPRRHVSDVPRNNKYWDHDDRCDKDYNS